MSSHTPDGTSLATEAAAHPYVFAGAFGTGDPDLLDGVYEPDAVFVTELGAELTGTARHAANARFQSLGLPIEVVPRRTVVAGDVALLIVDWTITGTAADGVAVEVRGTATDVARRGNDGRWRYVIDVPFGVDTC
jgi:ketosteroid isomerase-like protein